MRKSQSLYRLWIFFLACFILYNHTTSSNLLLAQEIPQSDYSQEQGQIPNASTSNDALLAQDTTSPNRPVQGKPDREKRKPINSEPTRASAQAIGQSSISQQSSQSTQKVESVTQRKNTKKKNKKLNLRKKKKSRFLQKSKRASYTKSSSTLSKGIIDHVPEFEKSMVHDYDDWTGTQKLSFPHKEDEETSFDQESKSQDININTNKDKLTKDGLSLPEKISRRLPDRRTLINIGLLLLLLIGLMIYRLKGPSPRK